MTVDELNEQLVELSQRGRGGWEVTVKEYDVPSWIERDSDLRKISDIYPIEESKEVVIE